MGTTLKKRKYEITSGPTRALLCDKFKYAHDDSVKITVDFELAAGYTMPRNHPGCAYIPMDLHDVTIKRIEDADDNLILHGECKTILHGEPGVYSFVAEYNPANNPVGWVTFE